MRRQCAPGHRALSGAAAGGRGAGGFTLIELMVAVGIFAVIAAIAYTALQTVMNTRQRTELQMQRLAQLQMAFTIMGRDIEQAVRRGVRDNYGDPMPAMTGSMSGAMSGPMSGSVTGSMPDSLVNTDYQGVILELTRLGWRNPTGVPRSDMQRVAYLLKDKTLVRQYWTELDLAPQSKPLENDLLDGVNGVDVKFMDQAFQWQNQWPPSTTDPQQNAAEPFPRAIEVSVDSRYLGRVSRVFLVP